MSQPVTFDPTDLVLRFVSTGALGIGVAIALLATVAIVLPSGKRSKLKVPVILLGLHILTVLAQLPLDPASTTARVLYVLGLFVLLIALGRATFLLVVEAILDARLHRPVPRIFRDILQGLVFIGVVFITLRAAGVEPGSLLTTSALLTAVIGLSLQDTLGNLVSGLSIQAQRPFEVGDWIQIDPDPRQIGRVIEINWRATTVLTLEHVELIIPNGHLAKTSIRNFSKPAPLARRTIQVQGPYGCSPRRVEQALLSAAHAVSGVRTEPAPFAMTSSFDDSGITYSLCYFIDDFSLRDRIDSAVRQRIWFSFKRAGISVPFPIRTVYSESSETAREETEARAARLEALRGVDFLGALPAGALEKLATLAKTVPYMMGEVILRQGDTGHDLFVIQSGEVAVMVGRGDGSVAELTRLGPGKFFGEMSLMTGERRSATIQATADCQLVVMGKEPFHEILSGAPHLAEKVTQILVERQIALEENLSVRTVRNRTAETEAKSTALLARIRQFFSL